jgi:transposase-like protein
LSITFDIMSIRFHNLSCPVDAPDRSPPAMTRRPKTPTIDALARETAYQRGEECPSCSNSTKVHGPNAIEWNGVRGIECGYRCTVCDHRWDRIDYSE